MKNRPFSLQTRVDSFRFALHGLRVFAWQETQAKIQIALTLVVLTLGFAFDISKFEWIAILLSIAVVLALEIVNSAIERLCDLYSRNRSPLIKEIKDLAASAVLITSVVAALNGILIFVPKIFVELSVVFSPFD